MDNTEKLGGSDFTALSYLRFLFYLYFAYKLIEIVFMRRKKIKAIDRVERKIRHAHGPIMLEKLSPEDKQLLDLTILNTFQNATFPLAGEGKKSIIGRKRQVNFVTESNIYYDPPDHRSSRRDTHSMQEDSHRTQEDNCN